MRLKQITQSICLITLFLTGNTDTVYCFAFLDLKKDGPTVVEIPAGAGPGTVNDAFFRFVIDMGAPGSDKGNYLDGANTYKLNLPKDAPAEKFMSVVVYDPQTRSELQTGQPFPGKNNKHDKMIVNDDGSIDLYFGPEAPAGKEANWIQMVPGKGWLCLLHLYSPTQAWWDKTWRPGEIELVK